MEQNKVIRHYHGHLSAVQDLAIHPTLDILVSCARDSTTRVGYFLHDNILLIKFIGLGYTNKSSSALLFRAYR